MSRKLIVPGVTFTGPRLRSDPLAVTGSLALVEPGNPTRPWAAGVPASGTAVTNIVADEAARAGLVLPSHVVSYGTDVAGVNGLKERTAKGGMHFAVKETGWGVQRFAQLKMGDNFKAYMRANPGHVYYHSLWQKVTSRGSSPQACSYLIARDDNNQTHTYWYRDNLRPDTGTGSVRIAAQNFATPLATDPAKLRSVTATKFYTAADNTVVPASNGAIHARLMWGYPQVTDDGTNYNGPVGQNGWVLYRWYVEDLTVSGRSTGTVLAADQALFDAAFGTGGRYAGDTFTDPTTVLV